MDADAEYGALDAQVSHARGADGIARFPWVLEQDKLAVLTTLMLRGIQTAGELRSRSGRLHEFASVGEVETALQFLVDKYPPLVARLAKAPGAKEPVPQQN